MALIEIARFDDVYEADLAAAFLASHDIEVTVTERFQTTIDPLMQRALGIRLLGVASIAAEARSLLARAQAGEFADLDDGDDIPVRDDRTWLAGAAFAVLTGAAGGFWGTTLPRRFRGVPWQGVLLSTLLVSVGFAVALAIWTLLFDPP